MCIPCIHNSVRTFLGCFFWRKAELISVSQPVALGIIQLTKPFRQVPAQLVDIVVGVDVRCANFQPGAILLRRFLPWSPRHGFGEPVPHPRHRCLVQHQLLQLSWLSRGICGKGRLQAVSSQGFAVSLSDPARACVVEAVASVGASWVEWCLESGCSKRSAPFAIWTPT